VNYAYVVSLKFSPVFFTLCQARARLLAEWMPVVQLLSGEYRSLGEEAEALYLTRSTDLRSTLLDTLRLALGGFVPLLALFRCKKPGLVIFENSHPANLVVALLAKLCHREALVASVIHEPFKADKRVYGLPRAIYIAFVELCQTALLAVSGAAIVPSQTALAVFRQRYPRFARPVYVIPLYFGEEAQDAGVERQYVTFLGHAAPVKGIARFFSLVESAVSLDLPYRFQIATSSDIDSYLDRLSPAARDRLRAVRGDPLPDARLYEAAASSICVLALYETVMQSAVVPVALMRGTPVIATRLDGLTEVIEHGRTGWIVDLQAPDQQIFEAIRAVEGRLPEMSPQCREAYERMFTGPAVAEPMGALLAQAESGAGRHENQSSRPRSQEVEA
jgi:glycosyltransferase involved in cell wall biosynthesis